MGFEQADVKEPAPGDWLELANGGGVMLRDPAALPPPRPLRYVRRLKQLRRPDDGVEP